MKFSVELVSRKWHEFFVFLGNFFKNRLEICYWNLLTRSIVL